MPTHAMLERDELVLVQRPRRLEFHNEYAVLDEHGAHIGVVIESRPAAVVSLLRLGGDVDVLLPVTLELRDTSATRVLRMSKPWARLVTHVAWGDGTSLGCVRRRFRLGKARFELVADHRPLGQVRAENWRSTEFTVVDAVGRELARAEKQGGDNEEPGGGESRYLIRIYGHAVEPLRSLAVGAALALEAVVPHEA